MKKVSIIGMGLLTAFSAILSSCESDEAVSKTSYLPFLTSQNGKWGMISTDGTVLFEDEFKDMPTSVKNDRFLVQNGNGLWEIYTAEAKPEKIGEEYLQIADFTASVTPSVKKNEKICLINTDGDVKATLDKANNKNIVKCSYFSYGYATIVTEDDMCGIINTKGELVIDAKYVAVYPISNNSFIAVLNNNEEATTIKVLNASGKDVLEMNVGNGQKYLDINPEASTSKYLAVCTSVDGERQWGFIDYSKNVVIKPSSKIKRIVEVKGDKFIFSDGENCGVMNFNGDVILRAKYDNLSWADDDVLISYDSDNYSLINLEGDKLTKEKYLAILPFYDGKYAAVKIDDNSWGFVDKKGEEIKLKNAPDIYHIGPHSASMVVESDFVDIDAIVARLKLDKNGLMGFNLDMLPQQVIKAYNEVEGNTNERLGLTAEENRYRDRVITAYSSRGLEIESRLYYQRYMTESIDGNTTWSKEHPQYIEAYVGGDMINGKVDLLYSKVAATIKSYGKVMRENSGAIVVQLSDERGWIVTNEKSKMHIKIFNNNDFQGYNIDFYAKDNENTKEYIKSVGNNPQAEIDTDSVEVVDSIY